jgi:hypothetical protein
MQRIARRNHGNRCASTIATVHRLTGLICALATGLGAAGCGRDDDHDLPVACESGAGAVRAALTSAPGEVRVEGTPISGCFVRSSTPADVQLVGATYVAVASELAAGARREPKGAAATRLGYLVGAARRGASRTQGIHDELVRRIEQELIPVDTGSEAFRRGERAGRASG